jgi:hypothetical protein
MTGYSRVPSPKADRYRRRSAAEADRSEQLASAVRRMLDA